MDPDDQKPCFTRKGISEADRLWVIFLFVERSGGCQGLRSGVGRPLRALFSRLWERGQLGFVIRANRLVEFETIRRSR